MGSAGSAMRANTVHTFEESKVKQIGFDVRSESGEFLRWVQKRGSADSFYTYFEGGHPAVSKIYLMSIF